MGIPVLAGVPKGLILGPLLFLIYINDLPDNLKSLAILFVNDTLLFSAVHDPSKSEKFLNNDFQKISDQTFKWKMLFNSNVIKQAQEVIFSCKSIKQITQLSILMKRLLLKLLFKSILECI